MSSFSLKYIFQIKYWIAAIMGMSVSLLVWRIMKLDYRYGVAVVGGLIFISISLMVISKIEDFLVYTMIFNAPFDRFGKWLFAMKEEVVIAPGIAFGLAEVLILGAYLVWFAQIFIAKTKSIPKLQNIDYFIILFVLAHCFSMLGAPVKKLSLFDTIYNIKHVLIYFFLVNKLKRRHLKWVVVIVMSAILAEASLASYERLTGNVGIGHSKGNVQDEVFGSQYEVPGIEGTVRAEGTTKDSHALGLYLAMILPVPLVFSTMDFMKPYLKTILTGFLIIGVIALILTFSRSGWLCYAISSSLALWVIIFSWKRGRTILYIMSVIIAVSLVYPQAYTKIIDRFTGAPSEIMSTRYDMAKTGLNVWGHNLVLGCGAGNYIHCLYEPEVTRYEDSDLPVHVMFLFVASEIGIVGVLTYYIIIFIALVRCFKMLKCRDPLIRGFSLAIITAIFAYLLDGLTSPLGRELVPYYTLWVYIAISLSFKRMMQEQGNSLELA